MKKSKKKKLKFKPEDTIKSLFDQNLGKYKSQLLGELDVDKGGEYRGYYPTQNGVWRPKSSQRGGRQHGAHNGADIYTGYGAFPSETPIRAATNGDFLPIFDAESPNLAGNRAAISTKIGADKIDFRYGHLSRFALAAGPVLKGQIIGYAGCSGNADTAGECTEEGPCGLTSCHVHLISSVNNNFSTTPDPIAMLGWKLKYGPEESEESKERKCVDIVNQAKKFVPERQDGKLKTEKKLNHRRFNRRRNALTKPYKYITFDATRDIRSALAAYVNLQDRMQSTITKHSKNKNTFGDDVTNFMQQSWSGKLKWARNEPKTAQGRALAVLKFEIELLQENKSVVGMGGPATRSLMAAAKALWLLTGGAAIQAGMSNRTLADLWDTAKSNKFQFKNKEENRKFNPLNNFYKKEIVSVRKDGKTRRRKVTMSPPTCGVGVNGLAALVSSEHAQCAHHESMLNLKDKSIGGVQATGFEKAVALDFGSTSAMQAIWPINLGKYLKTNDNPPHVKTFCNNVSKCLVRYMNAYRRCFVSSAALSLTDPTDARRSKAVRALVKQLNALHDDIESTFEGFLVVEPSTGIEAKKRQEEIKSLLSVLVEFNTALLEAGRDRSLEKEKTIPIAPKMVFLSIDIANAEEKAEAQSKVEAEAQS